MGRVLKWTWGRRELARVARWATMGVFAFVACALGPIWVDAVVSEPLLKKIIVWGLLGGEIVYGALLATVPILGLALTVGTARARRRGARRRWAARGLALCVSLAFAMCVAECAAAAWLHWARVPMPWLSTDYPDPTGDRQIDVLALGESSAFGVPYHDWFSAPAIVAWKLREAFPGRRFALEMMARPGLTLDKVHDWMRSIARRPELAILYAGHNEFCSRYNWGHAAYHYRDVRPAVHETLSSFARDHSPLCRLVQNTIGIYQVSIPPPRAITRRLVDVPVYTPEEYAERLENFEAHLEAMVTYLEMLGARVVLVPPPGNDADFEPNRSFLPPGTTREEREAFAADFEAARRLEKTGPAGSMSAYRALIDRQPGFAEAHYRFARLLEAAGRRDEANAHYTAARDLDGFPMRCTSDFLRAYDRVAARHPRAILIDVAGALRNATARGVLGDELFADAMHPSLNGYAAIARAVLQGLYNHRVFDWPASAPPPVVTPADCAGHYKIDTQKWSAICDYVVWFYEMTAFLRFDASERLNRLARFRNAKFLLDQGRPAAAVRVPGIGAVDPPDTANVAHTAARAPGAR